jgi:hypothetical protein
MAIAMESLMSNENKIDGIFLVTNTLSMVGVKQLLNINVLFHEDIKLENFGLKNVKPFLSVRYGSIPIDKCVVAVVEMPCEIIIMATAQKLIIFLISKAALYCLVFKLSLSF